MTWHESRNAHFQKPLLYRTYNCYPKEIRCAVLFGQIWIYHQLVVEPDHPTDTEPPHFKTPQTCTLMQGCRWYRLNVISSTVMCQLSPHVDVVENHALRPGPLCEQRALQKNKQAKLLHEIAHINQTRFKKTWIFAKDVGQTAYIRFTSKLFLVHHIQIQLSITYQLWATDQVRYDTQGPPCMRFFQPWNRSPNISAFHLHPMHGQCCSAKRQTIAVQTVLAIGSSTSSARRWILIIKSTISAVSYCLDLIIAYFPWPSSTQNISSATRCRMLVVMFVKLDAASKWWGPHCSRHIRSYQTIVAPFTMKEWRPPLLTCVSTTSGPCSDSTTPSLWGNTAARFRPWVQELSLFECLLHIHHHQSVCIPTLTP